MLSCKKNCRNRDSVAFMKVNKKTPVEANPNEKRWEDYKAVLVNMEHGLSFL